MKPEKQLKLYGFKNVFNELINIDANGNFPNKILFSGIKGIGKSTLAYHLTNYFLSYSENNKYNIDENQININNNSFNWIRSGWSNEKKNETRFCPFLPVRCDSTPAWCVCSHDVSGKNTKIYKQRFFNYSDHI